MLQSTLGIIAHTDQKDGRIIDASVFYYSNSLRTRFIAEPLYDFRGTHGDVAIRRKQELRLKFRKSEKTAIAFAEELLKQTEAELNQ